MLTGLVGGGVEVRWSEGGAKVVRVAYMSSDMKLSHPIGQLLVPLLQRHHTHRTLPVCVDIHEQGLSRSNERYRVCVCVCVWGGGRMGLFVERALDWGLGLMSTKGVASGRRLKCFAYVRISSVLACVRMVSLRACVRSCVRAHCLRAGLRSRCGRRV